MARVTERRLPQFSSPDIVSDLTSTPIQARPYANYAEDLEALRTEYLKLDAELCPPSRPPSPSAPARTDALKTRIQEAMRYAGHNPASTKWTGVAKLVKMASTSRRYCGVGPGVRMGEKVQVDVGNFKFVMPETEEEWRDCEQRWERRFEKSPAPEGRTSKFFASGSAQPKQTTKADLVRDKVKAWQSKVVSTVPAVPEVLSETDTPSSSKGKGKELDSKRQSPLPFPVAKRNAVATSSGKDASAADPVLHEEPSVIGPPAAPLRPFEEHRSPPGIADLSEMEYIPPSFPAQLETSTPPVTAKTGVVAPRSKPPPILPRPYPSSPSSSPLLPNHSLDRIPPPRASTPDSSAISPSPRQSGKRPLTPPSEGSSRAGPSKRPRIVPEHDLLSSAPPPPSTPPQVTSPLKTPPRPVSSGKGLGNAKGLPVPSTPDRHLPTLTELLASSRRSKPRPRPPSRKLKSAATTPAPEDRNGARAGSAPADVLPVVDEAARESSPAPTVASRARTLLSSPASGSSGSPQSFHEAPRSPVSPLFSQRQGAFVPPFASTQVGGGFGDMAASQPPGADLARTGSGGFALGYNSQFDVEGQVGMVSDLLERDVDFDGWLRDIPEVEAET